jgi:crotonobetainyl-CoA:carnitine CoA-transferase CaiB-like acyl-CoA transferase
VIVGGNGDAIYRRLMVAMGRPDLADDPRLADNAGRVAHQALIDEAITAWTIGQDLATAVSVLEDAGVPVGPVYDAPDILADPHYAERGMLVPHEVEMEPGTVRSVTFPGVVPRLERFPGSTRGVGPDLGAHTAEVLAEVAGIDAVDLARLREGGVV